MCNTIDIKVLLEGSYDGSGIMRTTLNSNYLLPGQDLSLNANPIALLLGEATPVGQPYDRQPWNHDGTEGDRFGDSSTNNHAEQEEYASDIVDWVLVSIREGDSLATSMIWRCAGLLHLDGTVEFPEECDCLISDMGEDYFIVVEHRNHLPIMTSALQVSGGGLTYDFTINDSWIYELLPGIPLGVGQKLVDTYYMMYAANGDQLPGDFDRRDVNSGDNTAWFNETGDVFKYRDGDFDMNADINSGDDTIWFINAGITNTQIPFETND